MKKTNHNLKKYDIRSQGLRDITKRRYLGKIIKKDGGAL